MPNIPRLRILLAACLFFIGPSSLLAQGSYALRGTLATPAGLVENGIVLVRQGKIAAVGAKVKLAPQDILIDTHGVIAPGLIDLHNHLTYNIFPRWHPVEEFGNRYDWQKKQIYQTLIESPHHALVADGLECEMERYAEVKAVTEGETSLVGSMRGACSAGLAHNLDTESAWHVAYDVFPLQTPEPDLALIRRQLSEHQLNAFLIHLSEGGHEDASAAREFAMLKGRGLLLPGVALIHGVALQPPDFTEMAAHGVGLIWSPRSNLELYGNTADVAAGKAAGVKIALSPDWSPTGSDGLLAELNYASTWNDTQKPSPFTDRELVDMATAVPAEMVGAGDRLGALRAGIDADLLVIAPGVDAGKHDGWWILAHATAAQVSLVTIDGAPVYGDAALLAKFPAAHAGESVEACGVKKGILFTGTHGNVDAGDETWAHTAATLQAAMRHHGRNLAELAECGQ